MKQRAIWILAWLAAVAVVTSTQARGGQRNERSARRTSSAEEVPLDRYGGWTGIEFEATGFFRVEERDGWWWLVTPEGHAFFSTGMNHISAQGDYAPDLGYSPYQENVMSIYGSEEAWAEEVYDRLTAWHFNTIGAWSQSYWNDRMPWTTILYISDYNWEDGTVPDYFAPEWPERADAVAASRCAPHKEDPYLVGYFLDNEQRWSVDWRSLLSLFDTYMTFPPDAPGKIALVDTLRRLHFDNIESLNRAWGTNLESFDEILELTELGDGPDSLTAHRDKSVFTSLVADQYFRIATLAVRKYDPNHLILGSRFTPYTLPRAVVEAAAPYLDVISINYYELVGPLEDIVDLGIPNSASIADWCLEYHELSGLPIMLTEFSYRADDSGLPNSWPPHNTIPTYPTQEQRAKAFAAYAYRSIMAPYVVGYHWFEYADEPAEGRFDGENSNFGAVDIEDRPYEVLVNQMAISNLWPYTLRVAGD